MKIDRFSLLIFKQLIFNLLEIDCHVFLYTTYIVNNIIVPLKIFTINYTQKSQPPIYHMLQTYPLAISHM